MSTDPRVPTPSWLNAYNVTQTYDEHLKNAGASLGGTDWAMGRGTNLYAAPAGGVVETATASTSPRPSWYNTGLGYAIAVRRSNGTRTVMAHCSGFVVSNGATVSGGQHIAESGGQKGSEGAGTSTGGHVHIHDVLADGQTRAPAFTTISGWAGGDIESLESDVFTAEDKQWIHDEIVKIFRSDEFSKSAFARTALDTLVEKDNASGTGTLGQTTRDARIISRRTEQLLEKVAEKLGVS